MLRIFKKIKPGKPAGENSGSFWKFAIAESVLIFLGILLALQVDNWNQDRKDRELEKVLLEEMLSNLRNDLRDVEYGVDRHSHALNSNIIVLEFLEGSNSYHDSLESHFGHLWGGTILNANISTYESLKSIGIDLISNDNLRKRITRLYSKSYDYIMKVEQNAHKHGIEFLSPSISEHLYTIDFDDRAYPLDVTAMKQSNSFRHHLKINVLLLQTQLNAYNNAKRRIVILIENIEKELDLDPGVTK